MASVRNLKKDINYLTSEIVTEVYVRKMLFDEIKEADFKKVVVDAINFRNDLIAKVNHPDGKDNPKKIKAFFKDIKEEMDKKFSELIKSINQLK
jgi:hypothetical protein